MRFDKLHSEQINSKTLNDKFASDSKLRLFIDIFRAIAGEYMDDVKKENLINELINTGKFTEEDVLLYVKKAQKNGLIFERKLDMYPCTP